MRTRLLPLLLVFTIVASCTKIGGQTEDYTLDSRLVGKWELVELHVSDNTIMRKGDDAFPAAIYEFKNNGTFAYTSSSSTMQGKCRYSNGQLTLIVSDMTTTCVIKELTSKSMTWYISVSGDLSQTYILQKI